MIKGLKPNLHLVALLIIILMPSLATAKEAEPHGKFVGKVVLELIDSTERKFRLKQPFLYVSKEGKEWQVPAGAKVDGASIPKAFYSLIGGPFSENYLEASVVHDHHCIIKQESWQDVHLAFYHGMRANGVSQAKANIMYSAVYMFGPRWVKTKQQDLIKGRPLYQAKTWEKLQGFVKTEQPTLKDLQAEIEDLSKLKDVETLKQVQTQDKSCSAVIENNIQDGAYLLCDMNKEGKKLNAKRNLEILVRDLKKLDATQTAFLVPVLNAYAQNPTQTNWQAAQDWVSETRSLVKIAVHSALDYDSSLITELGTQTKSLLQILSSRQIMLNQLSQDIPTDPDQVKAWLQNYSDLMQRLRVELEKLQGKI